MTRPGFWIAHVTIRDADAYAGYRRAAAPAIAQGGGDVQVLGGQQEVVSGTARPHCVVVAFPSLQAARACYFGAAYQATIRARDAAAEVDLIIVEGSEA